jgi:thioredoxin-related protein
MSGKFRELKKRIDEAVCIYYRPSGEIRHTVYMFEDPKCYYCKEALLKIKGILVKHHADLKILFKASSDSRPIAIDAICRNAGLEKFIEMLYTQTNESERLSCEQGKMLADKASNLAKELYISKVPVFFLENGTMIQGANLTGLEYYLK